MAGGRLGGHGRGPDNIPGWVTNPGRIKIPRSQRFMGPPVP